MTKTIQEMQKTHEIFTRIQKFLEAEGNESAVVYTIDGIISYGEPDLLLLMYLTCDKEFISSTLPEIMARLPKKVVTAILDHVENHQPHVHQG